MSNNSSFLLQKKMKELREANGYTQQQIADILGIERTTYNKYENGSRNAGTEILLKLSEFYSVSIDDIYDIKFENEEKELSVFGLLNSYIPDDDFDMDLNLQEKQLISMFKASIRKFDILKFAQKICIEDNIDLDTLENESDFMKNNE